MNLSFIFYDFPFISLRLFNVYGTRSRTSGTYGAVFGVLLAQKLANKPFTVVGDGSQKRDFLYVTDVAEEMRNTIINNPIPSQNDLTYITKKQKEFVDLKAQQIHMIKSINNLIKSVFGIGTTA